MMFLRFFTVAVAAVVLLAGCSTASKLHSTLGNKYRYKYVLVSPSSGMRLSYSDQRLKILFRIDQGAIRFKLMNLTDQPLNVAWDSVSLGVKGRYHTVRNSRTLYLDNPTDLAVSTILPNGYIIDLTIPAQNVYFDGVAWRERDLLPTTDGHSDVMRRRIMNNKGSAITLLMPMRFGDQKQDYRFEFLVESVEEMDWVRYRRPRRPLPPPTQPVQVKKESSGQIVTAIVIAGLLGVSAVLLTLKKSPPSE